VSGILRVGVPDAIASGPPLDPTRAVYIRLEEGVRTMLVRFLTTPFARPSIRRAASAAAAALMLTLTATVDAQGPEAARKSHDREPVVFTIDVAEDFAKFVPTLVKPEHTQPERGSFFVTEGRIFPAGTIQGDGADFDPKRSGHVGVWFCRGTHLVAGPEIPAAPLWVDTAQLFVLGRQGKEQIATEGIEGSGTVTRVVTGGAGNYVGFVGEQRQTFLGFNSTGGVNLRVTFILRRVAK
jgi:hypothetical protein